MVTHPCGRPLLLLFALLVITAMAQGAPSPLHFVSAAPEGMITQGVTFVPLRLAAETLGATVRMAKGTITTTLQGHSFTCAVDSTRAMQDGKPLTLAKATFLRNESLYVPLAPLVQALSGTVTFDAAARRCITTLPGMEPVRFPVLTAQQWSLMDACYGTVGLYLTDLDGTEPCCLSANAHDVREPAFSPDGTRLVYLRDGELVTRRVDSPNEDCLLPYTGAHYVRPRFTPDNRTIIFQQTTGTYEDFMCERIYTPPEGKVPDPASFDWQLWAINVDGSGKRPLGTGRLGDISPDGRTLVCTVWGDAKKTAPAVELLPIDGGTPRLLGPGQSPVFNARGDAVLYARSAQDGTLQLVRQSVQGDQPAELLPGVCGIFGDGERLVTVGDGLTLRHPGSTDLRLTEDESDFHPTFTADGARVLFLRNNEQSGMPWINMSYRSLLSIRTDGSEEWDLTDGFYVHEYALAPDGTHVVVTAQYSYEAPEREQEPAPAFTATQAQAYLTELLPLVEEAAGRRFITPPIMRVVTRRQVRNSLGRDYGIILPLVDKSLCRETHDSPDRMRRYARAEARLYTGYYGISDHTIYLMPGNLTRDFTAWKTDAALHEPVAKLVLAMQLACALQDQQLDVASQYRQLSTNDALMALSATRYGHALYITEKVAERLGITPALDVFTRMLIGENRDAGAHCIVEDTYRYGHDFIAWQAQHHGVEGVWEALAAPPVETHMIYHPDAYDPVPSPESNPAAKLSGIFARVGAEKWRSTDSVAGEMSSRALFAALPPADRDRLRSATTRVYSTATADGLDKSIVIAVFEFTDKAQATFFLDTMQSLYVKTVSQMRTRRDMTVTKVVSGTLPGIRADRTLYTGYTEQRKNWNESTREEMVYVQRDACCLSIYTTNYPLTPAQYVVLAEDAFTRIAK